MNDQTKGIYRKFNVSRVDGRDQPGGDKHGAEYFVLDMTHDPHARAALLAYAVSCRGDYPALSRDLLAKCDGVPGAADQAGEAAKHLETVREWARHLTGEPKIAMQRAADFFERQAKGRPKK